MSGAGGPAMKVSQLVLNLTFIRMAFQFMSMLAMPVWRKKHFILQMAIYLLYLSKVHY